MDVLGRISLKKQTIRWNKFLFTKAVFSSFASFAIAYLSSISFVIVFEISSFLFDLMFFSFLTQLFFLENSLFHKVTFSFYHYFNLSF